MARFMKTFKDLLEWKLEFDHRGIQSLQNYRYLWNIC